MERKNKLFNFYLIGFQAFEEDGKSVKPICPFSKDSQEVVYRPSIDYQSGMVKEALTISNGWERRFHKISGTSRTQV